MTCLWGVFSVNFARIEARHPTIDLLTMPIRRALNLAYELLLEAHQFDSDGWERDYAPIFAHDDDPDAGGVNWAHFGGRERLESSVIGVD